jgi:alpha-galactosidase
MVEEGLAASGYDYLTIDDCWVAGRNATTGELYPDPTRFPNGIASLAAYVHSKGLKLGIYTDVTPHPCIHGQYHREKEEVPGSWGHYQQDASIFAKWGIDYVKADFCTGKLPNGSMIDPEVAYPAFSRALNATGRPMYFIVCYDRWFNKTSGAPFPGYRPVWEWVHPWANAYRLGRDHHDDWTQLSKELDVNANRAHHSIIGSFGDFDFITTGGQGCGE